MSTAGSMAGPSGADLRDRILGPPPARDGWPAPLAACAEALSAGEVDHLWDPYWTRPGLDARARLVASIATMIALGQEDQLRPYLAGALRSGLLSEEELGELVMHAAGYTGFPKSLAARHVLQAVFDEEEA
jgi:4-carboxymuconolactone decarboxylase